MTSPRASPPSSTSTSSNGSTASSMPTYRSRPSATKRAGTTSCRASKCISWPSATPSSASPATPSGSPPALRSTPRTATNTAPGERASCCSPAAGRRWPSGSTRPAISPSSSLPPNPSASHPDCPATAAPLSAARGDRDHHLHPLEAAAGNPDGSRPDDHMTATLIDGKAAAAAIRLKVASQVAEFERQSGRPPGLATVLVGEDPASAVYVRSKNRATAEANMASFAHNLPDTTTEPELLQLVTDLNADERVDGILVQLPLPDAIDSARVIATIDPAKDVDGFHAINAGRLATGLDSLVPCTPLGCLHLLKAELGNLAGLNAVVIGRSNIVG